MANPRPGPAEAGVLVGEGMARLLPDPDRPTGRLLLVNGVEQSYVDVSEPEYLHFDYVRRMASVVDAAAARRSAVRALHLGAGALTLARYVAATRPGSVQIVVDRDAALVDLVRRELPLPEADLRILIRDARAAVADQPDAGFDLVLADVYRAARMPAHVATSEFAADAARVLDPDGIYLVNLTDLPPLVATRVQVATLGTAFAEICLIANRGMLRGRRYGNVVLAAARRQGRLPLARLARAAARDRIPGMVLHGAELHRFAAGAVPARDGASPPG